MSLECSECGHDIRGGHAEDCPRIAVKIVKITRFDADGDLLGSYCNTLENANVLLDEIKEAEIGESWKIELCAMSAEEYENMPEFAGY